MSFAIKGDKTEKYNLWKQRMMIFSQTQNKKDAALVPYILQGLDDEGLKIFNSFNLTEAQLKEPKNIFNKFEERLKISKPSFRAARLDLHFYYQKEDESVDEFYTRCRQKIADCEYTEDEAKERVVEHSKRVFQLRFLKTCLNIGVYICGG